MTTPTSNTWAQHMNYIQDLTAAIQTWLCGQPQPWPSYLNPVRFTKCARETYIGPYLDFGRQYTLLDDHRPQHHIDEPSTPLRRWIQPQYISPAQALGTDFNPPKYPNSAPPSRVPPPARRK